MEQQDSWVRGFSPDVCGTYLDRPNRFVARILVENEVVEAHCANPGRLTELLFPGDLVYLERAREGRKLAYTLVAVKRPSAPSDEVVPLVSVRANEAVGKLFLPGLFPGARRFRPEFTLGSSRFDWAVEDAEGRHHLIEVKACSEIEAGAGLFPDAPSVRASRHLEELTAWGQKGWIPHVVVALVHGSPGWWGPNHHTDPVFGRTLLRCSPYLHLHGVLFRTDAQGVTRCVRTEVPVRLAGPGPDAGAVVRIKAPSDGAPGWLVEVEERPAGWEKAAARGPARSTFAVRGGLSPEARADLRPGPWPSDPRLDRRFVTTLFRERRR